MPSGEKWRENKAFIENQFSSTKRPRVYRGGRRKTLLPVLRRLLEKRIKYHDPETQKLIEGTVKDAIVWRLIMNAAQGDNTAIKEILDRIDGKIDLESLQIGTLNVSIYRPEPYKREEIEGEVIDEDSN